MEISNVIIRMLEHMDRSSFIVKDSIIVHANQASVSLGIQPNISVNELLHQDYTPNITGTQSLKLAVLGSEYSATVENIEDYDLFVLEHDSNINELRVLALASQKLRAPLTTLMNSIEDTTPIINRSLHQLHRAVSNMSDAYRYQIFHEPKLEPTALCAFMDELIESIYERIKETGIELSYKGLNSECFCLIDRELLERCILNLVSNSIAAESTKIHIKLKRTKNQLLLTIDDNGNGIPSHLRNEAFHHFHRDPELTCEGGLGLGMQIVQAAAAAHNGTVLMAHRDDVGIRITVTLSVMKSTMPVRSPGMKYDYLGGRDHALTELSEVLPLSES